MPAEDDAQPPGGEVRRHFVFREAALRSDVVLREADDKGDLAELSTRLVQRLNLPARARGARRPAPRVTHRPLRDWEIDLPGDDATERQVRQRRTRGPDEALAMRFDSEEEAEVFRASAERQFGKFEEAVGDLRLNPALHWCPGRGEGGAFGTLADAHRLIRADALAAAGLDGQGVKVVIVDQGIDAARLPPGTRFMGGWWKPGPDATRPGRAEKDNHHGTMIARNILSLAPRAMIFDCPMIPPRIRSNLPAFLSDAFGVINRMAMDIALLALIRPRLFRGRWIFVNAWSVYDPRGETYPGEYTANRNHWLTRAVDAAAQDSDMVFAAGNCGQFCPDGRCAESLIGPGRSILGANSLDSVLTVGAARTDAIWAGYSSQGPGQFPATAGQPQPKPDLSAPSQFQVLDTAHRFAGGSSAACAIAAGVVAALRTRWDNAALPPAALFDQLRQAAWQPDGSAGWNARQGHGILDCAATLGRLAAVRGS